jgi:hypothetical protein
VDWICRIAPQKTNLELSWDASVVKFVLSKFTNGQWIALCLLLGTVEASGSACTILPGPPKIPTSAEIDTEARNHLKTATALVEVIATKGGSYKDAGEFAVVRVLYGSIAGLTKLEFKVYPGSMCGPERLAARSRGYLIIHDSKRPVWFGGFLKPSIVASMSRQNLIKLR